MAPFRASRSTRSTRPTAQTDDHIIDGLPVRQWRQQEYFIGPAQSNDPSSNNPAAQQKEIKLLPNGRPPLGLPPGSDQYTPWCIQILRAAREGRLKRKEPHDGREEEKENEEENEGETEASLGGFTARKWGLVPRHQEKPEPEFLAKRRPGLLLVGSNVAQANGEVGANGIIVEEPVRRRMPPPRRKPKKGPGRKKKMTGGEGAGVSASAEALEGREAEGEMANGDAEHGMDGADDGDEEEGEAEGSEEGELAEDGGGEEAIEEPKKAPTEEVTAPPAQVKPPDVDHEMKEAPSIEIKPANDESAPPGLEAKPEPGEIEEDAEEEEYEPPPPTNKEEESEDYEPPSPPPAANEPVPTVEQSIDPPAES